MGKNTEPLNLRVSPEFKDWLGKKMVRLPRYNLSQLIRTSLRIAIPLLEGDNSWVETLAEEIRKNQQESCNDEED
jgi:hypothetical protein